MFGLLAGFGPLGGWTGVNGGWAVGRLGRFSAYSRAAVGSCFGPARRRAEVAAQTLKYHRPGRY
jgi:hypothetical protein